MRHARKPDFILDLEKDEERPQTLSAMMPRLTIIARNENLNLTNPKDWKKAVNLLNKES